MLKMPTLTRNQFECISHVLVLCLILLHLPIRENYAKSLSNVNGKFVFVINFPGIYLY